MARNSAGFGQDAGSRGSACSSRDFKARTALKQQWWNAHYLRNAASSSMLGLIGRVGDRADHPVKTGAKEEGGQANQGEGDCCNIADHYPPRNGLVRNNRKPCWVQLSR